MDNDKKNKINPILRIIPFLFLAPVLYFLAQKFDWETKVEQSVTQTRVIVNPTPLGRPAPNFKIGGELTYTKQSFELSSLKGYPLIVHFWATWCGPCLGELPELLKLAKRLRQESFAFVAVSEDSDWTAVERFFLQHPDLSPLKDLMVLVLDPKGEIAARFGSSRFPETFLINRDFLMDNKFVGAQSWNAPEMNVYLEHLKKGSP